MKLPESGKYRRVGATSLIKKYGSGMQDRSRQIRYNKNL